MSEPMSASLNRATFALQSRLFVAMKRAGRVIDLVWLQHNPEYAAAVIGTAARMSDDEVQEIARRLQALLHDYLASAGPRPAPRAAPPPQAATAEPPLLVPEPARAPAPAPAPVAPAPATAAVAAPALLDRHLISLR